MIPEFIDIGGPWRVLPPGIHDASLQEIEDRFANNAHRELLFHGFKRGLLVLQAAGCRAVVLDGSYVTEKPKPNDFDACWDPVGVDYKKLDRVLLDFSDNRRRQKKKYYGEFFPTSASANGVCAFVDFFQVDTDTGKRKGILGVRLA